MTTNCDLDQPVRPPTERLEYTMCAMSCAMKKLLECIDQPDEGFKEAKMALVPMCVFMLDMEEALREIDPMVDVNRRMGVDG